MEKRRPKLSLFVLDAGIRLRLVRALSSRFRIEIISSKTGPVKSFRKTRPAVVLLCASPREMGRMGTHSHALKTENRPPFVGLIALAGLPPDPEGFRRAHLLDGIAALPADLEELVDWVNALLAGDGFIAGEPAPGNRWRKVLRRLSGFRASSTDE